MSRTMRRLALAGLLFLAGVTAAIAAFDALVPGGPWASESATIDALVPGGPFLSESGGGAGGGSGGAVFFRGFP